MRKGKTNPVVLGIIVVLILGGLGVGMMLISNKQAHQVERYVPSNVTVVERLPTNADFDNVLMSGHEFKVVHDPECRKCKQ